MVDIVILTFFTECESTLGCHIHYPCTLDMNTVAFLTKFGIDKHLCESMIELKIDRHTGCASALHFSICHNKVALVLTAVGQTLQWGHITERLRIHSDLRCDIQTTLIALA